MHKDKYQGPMNDFKYVILIRERDGRVVTLVEDDPKLPGQQRTCIFTSKVKAAKAGTQCLKNFSIDTWSIVEAP